MSTPELASFILLLALFITGFTINWSLLNIYRALLHISVILVEIRAGMRDDPSSLWSSLDRIETSLKHRKPH